ncbi:MAG: FkbM family methyltransferase [Alphaproteobacteria bacterium]|nr:FkbM family methyltransferase [Alphaproteobacteria bacterium]
MSETMPDDAMRKRLMQAAIVYEKQCPRATVKHAGQKVVLETPNRICAWRALSYFTKEPETIAWIGEIPEGGVLFDVGANIGLYTLWASLTRRAQVFAFEPESSSFAVLNANLRANELTQRCRAFCVGISDRIGFGTINLARAAPGASGHQVNVVTRGVRPADNAVPQGVSTTTLDHLVYEARFPCPSHIKIDVDGIEHAIIAGGDRLLRDPRLKSVLIEIAVKIPEHRAVVDLLVDRYGFTKDTELEAQVYAKTTGVAHNGNIIFRR